MRGKPEYGKGSLMKCYKAGWGTLSALVLAASLAGCSQRHPMGGGMPATQTERFTSVHMSLSQKAVLTHLSNPETLLTDRW